MVVFSVVEKTEIIFTFGECRRSLPHTILTLRRKYPNHAAKYSRKNVKRIINIFSASGSVRELPRVRQSRVRDPNLLREIEALIDENPHIGTREIARRLQISQTMRFRVLAKKKFHPYKLILQQELHGTDFERRVDFCQFIVDHPNIYDRILFSDEATFRSDSVVNRHNMHYWSRENPLWIRRVDRQRIWSLNVWGGIKNNRVFGPYFFEGHLNGQMYLDFLRGPFQEYLEELPLDEIRGMILQHDGAPAHAHHIVVDYLNDNPVFDEWIGRGRGALHPWPPRSPDLTSLDFFLWGYVKEQVYREEPTTRENMKDRIREAFANINANPGLLQRVKLSFLGRVEKCLQENGHQFEHLL